MITNGDGLEHS